VYVKLNGYNLRILYLHHVCSCYKQYFIPSVQIFLRSVYALSFALQLCYFTFCRSIPVKKGEFFFQDQLLLVMQEHELCDASVTSTLQIHTFIRFLKTVRT